VGASSIPKVKDGRCKVGNSRGDVLEILYTTV